MHASIISSKSVEICIAEKLFKMYVYPKFGQIHGQYDPALYKCYLYIYWIYILVESFNFHNSKSIWITLSKELSVASNLPREL